MRFAALLRKVDWLEAHGYRFFCEGLGRNFGFGAGSCICRIGRLRTRILCLGFCLCLWVIRINLLCREKVSRIGRS